MTTLCRGQSWPEAKPWEHRPCSAPVTDLALCWTCIRRLHALLRDLGDDLAELHTQLTRQTRQGTGGGRPRITPLPYDPRAADVLADARTVLHGWTRVAVDDGATQPADTQPAMLRTLQRHHWHTHPAAHELLDELRWTHAQVLACIDTPSARRYLGPCGVITGLDPDGTERTCDGDVYAIGEHVRCATCHAAHSRDDRLEWIAGIADDQLVSAAIAADVLTGWGVAVKAQAVYDWARRGRLLPHGHDHAGHPTYVLAEVRALAIEATRHREAKRGHADSRAVDRSHSA